MEEIVPYLGKKCPYLGGQTDYDKRLIKTVYNEKREKFLCGINALVTNKLKETYLSFNLLENLLNSKLYKNRSAFGSLLEQYLFEKFCSQTTNSTFSLEILPKKLIFKNLHGVTLGFWYEGLQTKKALSNKSGQEKIISLHLTNEKEFIIGMYNYLLTTEQTNFPIYDGLFISKMKHFIYVCVKSYGLKKITGGYAFQTDVKK